MRNLDVPLLRITYDDLVLAPERALTGMVRFLGQEVHQQRVRLAVAASDFTLLKAQEQASGFLEAPPGKHFFRQGDPHAWRTTLDPALQRRLIARLGDLIAVLGIPEKPPLRRPVSAARETIPADPRGSRHSVRVP